MTLVATMQTGEDRWLIAADSKVGEEKITRPADKLHVRHKPNIVFGFSGDEVAGLEFRRWLLRAEFPADVPLRGIASKCGEALARINGEHRSRARLSLQPDADDPLAYCVDVLMLVAVDSTVAALAFERSGSWLHVSEMDFYGKIGFYGIGSGWPYALIGHQAVGRFDVQPVRGELALARLLETAARLEPQCANPIRMYEVTPTETAEVLEGSDSLWRERRSA